MKKTYLTISLILLITLNNCAGYKPVFNTTNFQFKIDNYLIEGDKKIGNKIYLKLNRIAKSAKNNKALKSIDITINSTKSKKATLKDSAGKILEYKMTLSTKINIKDFITEDIVLNKIFVNSQSYKVQSQYYDTVKLENQYTENLIDQVFQDLLIQLSQEISK